MRQGRNKYTVWEVAKKVLQRFDLALFSNRRSTLMMVLQAQSGVIADSPDVGPTPSPLVPPPVLSPDEAASQLAVSKGQVRNFLKV